MRTLDRRVRKHQKNHPAIPLAVTVSSSSVLEAIEALATRVRWYETRGYATPPTTLSALKALCAAVGIDAMKVGAL